MHVMGSARTARVYALIDPRDGAIRYIGWTSNSLEQRLAQHVAEVRGRSHRVNWLRVLRRRGLQPQVVLVEEVPFDTWAVAERHWIGVYKRAGHALVNGTDGGEGIPGHRHSVDTKRKIGDASRRMVRTAAHRNNIARALTGVPRPPGLMARMSAGDVGRKASAATRARMVVAQTQVWAVRGTAPFAKLSDSVVSEIRAHYRRGSVTQESLAGAYGVSRTLISFIVNRKRRVRG